MYLCTERVYNYKLMIILTEIRWKIALGCFDYFFHLILIMITTHFNLKDLRRTIRDQGALMQNSLYINSNN